MEKEKRGEAIERPLEEAMQEVLRLSDRYEEEVLALRHELHQDPELSFCEYHTAERVEKRLLSMGLSPRTGIAGTGLVADIQGAGPGKVLLLRADMDALPIQEENDLPYRSQNPGISHACGHDVHTANLVGVARILLELRDKWQGTVRLVFQPGEERGGGGKKMLESGLVDDIPIDASFALHTMTSLPPGHLMLGKGYVTSYTDRFTIRILGKAAHSANPDRGVDAISIAAHVVTGINELLLKAISPMERATYSFGQIQGGTSPSIIAGEVVLTGMMRNVKEETRQILRQRMEEVATGVARAYGGEAKFEFQSGYPGVYNDPGLADFAEGIFRRFGESWLSGLPSIEGPFLVPQELPILGGEDYGFYSKRMKTCFYRVATGNTALAHTGAFRVEEPYIKLCTRSLASLAIAYLREEA